MVTTNLYPSTACDPAFVSEMQTEGLASGYVMPPPEHCAFTLISDCLVPETFIQRVMREIASFDLDYGFVLSKESLFSGEFLESLDEQERIVLMPVVLLLVARDAISLNLWASKAVVI